MFGTDIDRDAIGWVSENLAVCTNVNELNPPLPYFDEEMNVVYAISVLTHLDEATQNTWLAEIGRILQPGGLALLSVHSEEGNKSLSRTDQLTLANSGILFLKGYSLASKIFGKGYQNTYHTDDYIQTHWGRYFEIVGRIGMGRQDLIVLRKT